MNPNVIGNITNIIDPYVKAIRACKTKAELTQLLETEWAELCPDALAQARELPDDESWLWVVKHCRQKRHIKRVNELAGAILLPATILKIGELVLTFGIPDGCAYNQLHGSA